LGDLVFLVDDGAGYFVPLEFKRCDGSDFGHGPNLGGEQAGRVWRLRHNTGFAA
jgi:hypothetical protein